MISRLNFTLDSMWVKSVLAMLLVVSGVVGSYILATDKYLWAEAPTHAYGLIVFAGLDFVVAGAVFSALRLSRLIALLLPLVQFAAMSGDLYMGLGSPSSAIQTVFHDYLISDTAFMVLLVLQGVLIGLAFGNMVRPSQVQRAP
jgi:hypothetical protein